MAIGEFEDSFYDYAKKWFETVNRGGAFEVSDSAFNFFICLEKRIRCALATRLHSSSDCKLVVEEVVAYEDIQFHWDILSVDLDSKLAKEVLQDIVTLWLNIRGLTRSWMERRKKLCGASSRSGLRKSMKEKNLKEK